jgi:cobalamin biosynthesis Mg chelatase CobN
MIGMRRLSAPQMGRQMLVVSVLALLALACLPVLAQADSSGIQYEDATPTATTHGSQIPSGSGGSPAHSSDTKGGGSASGGSSNSDSSEAGSSQESESTAVGGVPANGGNDGNDGKGQGNPGRGAKNEALSPAKPLGNAPGQDDGGGSSPLVPILIAIAVLAAISVGVVAFRQRRRGSGTDARVSPEAS